MLHCPGQFMVTWKAGGIPAGIFFYKLTEGNQLAAGKMIAVKQAFIA
jgi:hypothetical protein